MAEFQKLPLEELFRQLEEHQKENPDICIFCGAKIVEYPHVINKGLCTGLYKLEEAGGVAVLKELGFNYSMESNFQKLKHWDLVIKHYEDGKRVVGCWSITEKGKKFLRDEIRVRRRVWTYRDKRERYDGERIAITDYIDTAYLQREDYAKRARPHRKRKK